MVFVVHGELENRGRGGGCCSILRRELGVTQRRLFLRTRGFIVSVPLFSNHKGITSSNHKDQVSKRAKRVKSSPVSLDRFCESPFPSCSFSSSSAVLGSPGSLQALCLGQTQPKKKLDICLKNGVANAILIEDSQNGHRNPSSKNAMTSTSYNMKGISAICPVESSLLFR